MSITRRIISCYFVAVVLLSVMAVGCSGPSKAFQQGLADEAISSGADSSRLRFGPDLDRIRLLIEQDKSGKASKELKKWFRDNPDSAFTDHALYLKGLVLFEQKLYYQSFEAFDELLNNHAASALYEDVLYKQVKIACLFLTGEKRKVWRFFPASARTEGLSILDKVAERWPGSGLAGTAMIIKADYYFDRGRFLEAQHAYQLVIDDYKDGPIYRRALLGCAEATYHQYLGPQYDTTCLTDAMIRYQRYQLNFPTEAQAARTDQQIELIKNQQVLKEVEIADFYRRTKQPSAARHYWQTINGRWSGTDWARQAQKNLDANAKDSK